MKSFKLTLNSSEIEVFQDTDGKFIIPAAMRGVGTSGLKPACEEWILVQKPIAEKTVAQNVLKHGTGGINIDASRIGSEQRINRGVPSYQGPTGTFSGQGEVPTRSDKATIGRFPANLVLSHNPDCVEVGTKKVKGSPKSYVRNADSGNVNSYGKGMGEKAGKLSLNYGDSDGTETVLAWECSENCAVAMLDEQSGLCKTGNIKAGTLQGFGKGSNTYGDGVVPREYQTDNASGASRFFYCAKASKSDKGSENIHPTVKSTKLMSYFINMITPPDGLILDCFGGSGTTLIAAHTQGFKTILIEQNVGYCDIILARAEFITEKSASLN